MNPQIRALLAEALAFIRHDRIGHGEPLDPGSLESRIAEALSAPEPVAATVTASEAPEPATGLQGAKKHRPLDSRSNLHD